MSLSLHTIKKPRAVKKGRKRIGRGNASGHGTFSGRGLKGQKARSGVSGLKRLGMKQVLLRTPKERGFKSLKPKNAVVNLSAISRHFKDGEKVTPEALVKKELVKTAKNGIKVLGQGDLNVSNLEFSGLKLSASAAEKIKKNKGKVNK